MRFSGKNIVVTGGTSGFGEAIVKAFASEGAHVHFCGLIDSEGTRVQAEANALAESVAGSAAGSGLYHHADVRDEESVKTFIAAATASTGTLDIAVNNAGISHRAARFADQDPAMVSDVLQTNVMGIWYAMRHEIPLMLKNDGGAIINIASILSESGAEWMAAYGTSKHAVIGLTKSAALDYAGTGIRINAVSPGPMLTPMFKRALDDIGGDMSKFAGGFPKGGPANPAEVAKTVLYLASAEAGYTNGTNVVVDGGASTG